MYYPESDIIAAKWPKWQEAVEQLDDLLAVNAGKLLTREFLCQFIDESSRTVDSLLKEYVKYGAVNEVDAFACPNHPEVVQAVNSDEGDFYCDLCDEKYQADSAVRCSVIIAAPPTKPANELKSPSQVDSANSTEALPGGETSTAFRFDVAVSFAGDNKRDKIREIVSELRARMGEGRVFFDEDFEHEIAGIDADTYFQRVFSERTLLVVVCVCKRYNEKTWTRSEWRAIRSFISRYCHDERGRIRFLPIRFDDGEVDGLFTDLDVIPDVRERSSMQIAELIEKRLLTCRVGAARTESGIDADDNSL